MNPYRREKKVYGLSTKFEKNDEIFAKHLNNIYIKNQRLVIDHFSDLYFLLVFEFVVPKVKHKACGRFCFRDRIT